MQGGSQNQTGGGVFGSGAKGAQVPQWLQGLQLGQQIAQSGARPQMPQMPMGGMRPGMGGGMPPGMPQQGVVPGAQGMAPPMMGQPNPMAGGGMGMPQQPGSAGGINPMVLQMLLQRGMGR